MIFRFLENLLANTEVEKLVKILRITIVLRLNLVNKLKFKQVLFKYFYTQNVFEIG